MFSLMFVGVVFLAISVYRAAQRDTELSTAGTLQTQRDKELREDPNTAPPHLDHTRVSDMLSKTHARGYASQTHSVPKPNIALKQTAFIEGYLDVLHQQHASTHDSDREWAMVKQIPSDGIDRDEPRPESLVEGTRPHRRLNFPLKNDLPILAVP